MKFYDKKKNILSSIILFCISILGFSQMLSGQSFHDTKGDIDVNGAGQLQFTLPIVLPPGVKSVAPQVNLVYSSSSDNGIVGYGWNLSGLTAISRAGKTVEKDGEAKGVQLDYSDYYRFNGQRLILKSGEYGKNGAEYITEKYSNVKIKSIGELNQIYVGFKGPEMFEVTFEDGSVALYGKISYGATQSLYNATTPIEYNIVEWKDAQGNYVTYNYTSQGNVSVISDIQWGGNETLHTPHFNKIDFTYVDRSLVEDSYVGGVRLVQNKLLSEIKVSTDGNQLKKYTINYIKNGTNYQVVDKITEYNADNVAANPVAFTYPAPAQPALEFSNNNIDSFDNVKLSGDFNGDSYLDFIMNNGTVKLGGFNDTFTDISTGKIFNAEAKVVNTLLDEEGQIYNGNGIVQYEGGKVVGYIFRDNTFVKVFEKVVYVDPGCVYQAGGVGCNIQMVSFNEGDINGDGISDVFVTINRKECQFEPIPGCNDLSKTTDSGNTTNRPPLCQEIKCYTYLVGNYIVDLKNANNPLSTYSLDTGINENSYQDQKYMDIDGDGKVDIINVSNTAYTTFEFVKTAPTQYLKKVKFSSNLAETKASEFPVLFGDFNGDGNLDFTIPTTDTQENDNWRFYMGTGKGFSNFLKTGFLKYRKPDDYTNSQYPTFNIYRNFYTTSDINKDGKSDIVHINSFNKAGQVNSSGTILSRYFGYNISTYTNNGTLANGVPDFNPANNFGGTNYVTFDVGEFGLFAPITSQIKINNNYYDVLLFWKERMHKLTSPSSVGKLAQIQSIIQGGVTTSVDYLEVIPNNPVNSNFYKKVKKEYYPYFSLSRTDQSYAVSQLRQEGRKKDFRYRGMTGHMQGRGLMGYQQSARSSWYADGFENTKIWSGTEIDPLKYGVPVKEWSIRTNDENLIFPTDISENNTQLLSFKSIIYQDDQLLNGQVVTTVADADKPKIVTALVPKSTLSKDFLTGIVTTGSITYGDYYLPAQSISNINNSFGIKTTTFEYNHNPTGIGADYFIGRPKSKTEVVQAYGDTKSSKEEYTYENNLLKTLKTWNRDNTGYLQDLYTYDGFGNVIQKTVSSSIDSQTQTTKDEYEAKGRFVNKKTDNLGLESNLVYNNWGQVLSQTDPLGNTSTNTYDGWGKLLSSANSLEGTTTYQYDRDSNSNIIVTQYDPDGDESKKYSNKLGQVYKVTTKAFGQGQFVSIETQYDILGRKLKESEPYFDGQSASQWNTIAYDDTVFPAKVTVIAFNGKIMETSISGLTTTVKEINGYGRTTSKTADALGNTVSATDKGGTIQFSYNAAGEQIKAQYAENIVTTKFDAWGRKSEFNDPSNGIYKYEYNGFGQPKKFVSPKGTKEYSYNNIGQLINQTELSSDGVSTNKNITFSYDNFGRMILKSGTSNGKSYSSSTEFDTYGRIKTTIENSNGRTYTQKGFFYDDKSRVISYTKSLLSSGVATEVTIMHQYNDWNGELYQLRDKKSGKILWELQDTNAKGQVLTSKLGAATINNTYDNNGFLTNTNHSSAVKPNILQISYSFDAIRNELKNRSTGGDFNILESFTYDDNNRLISWTNPRTGQNSTNVYDAKGRILENDQVGQVKYENSGKIYQPTSVDLNTAGVQNYNNDLIQQISYNENNDPVFIDGLKGDVAFQYGLTSMRQRVTYGGNFEATKDGQYTKLYSEDGSFEVTINNKDKTEKHILYIGGTPYDSNILFVKNYKDTSGSGSYKFLHKDYLGSILAISDEAGNKVEQRHFDAWGNFTHLQLGSGSILTEKAAIEANIAKYGLITDRGYTSHEHFLEVGIIHMNGRLYDPLLRRFLNADENIQDPFNTQIYNKYGYAINNPLMYNDPSGEVLPFLIGVGLSYLGATLVSGAIIGAAISIGIYALQATLNNNWSFGGFAKALLTGSVTGAVSAGASEIFSASGFWATVGNGALAGAGSGGAAALITGDNFLEGVIKGAVIGGAVAGAGYTVNYYVKGYNKFRYKTAASDINGTYTYDADISHETMQNDVNSMRNNNFTKSELNEFGIGKDIAGFGGFDGYIYPGDGSKVYAYTTPRNFWTGTSDIIYAPITAQNKELLAATMVHETGHAYSQKLGILDVRLNYSIKVPSVLSTSEHFAIYKLEHVYAEKNLISMAKRLSSGFYINPDDMIEGYFNLNLFQRNLINNTYDKLLPVFTRFMFYGK